MNLIFKKTIAYRLLSIVLLFLLTYIWFGNLRLTTSFTIVSQLVAFTQYYIFELLWPSFA